MKIVGVNSHPVVYKKDKVEIGRKKVLLTCNKRCYVPSTLQYMRAACPPVNSKLFENVEAGTVQLLICSKNAKV